MTTQSIATCLWFDHQAEEAANFYVSIFENSKIEKILRYGKEGFDIHGGKAGTVMTVSFQLEGKPFTALNGGPLFKFTEAISFQKCCDTQEEIDYYWGKLGEGGTTSSCGWLKDKYGVSWQVTPSILPALLADPAKSAAVTKAFLQMNKFDLATLQNA